MTKAIRWILFFILLLSLLSLPALSQGATYYCSVAGGPEAHTGADATHCFTLTEALAAVAAGDTVLLQTGDYAHFRWTANLTGWITWREDAGQTVVFTDGMSFGGYSSSAHLYQRFENIEIQTNTVSTASGAVRNAGVYVTGGTTTSTTGPGYLWFQDCLFTQTIASGENFMGRGVHHVTFRGSKMTSSLGEGTDRSNWAGHGIYIINVSNAADLVTDIDINDVEITRRGNAVSFTGTNLYIRNSWFHELSLNGILLSGGAVNCTITDNEVNDIRHGTWSTAHPDFLQGQTAHPGEDPDATVDTHWDNIQILRNVVHDIWYRDLNQTPYSQLIHFGGLDFEPPTNVTIANNVGWNVGSHHFDCQEMGANFKFNHNTFVTPVGGNSAQLVNVAAGWEAKNNILEHNFSLNGCGAGTATGNVSRMRGSLPIEGNQVLAADVFRAMFTDYGTVYTGGAQPAGVTGGGDYTLATGVAAIDYCAIIDPNTDILGMERTDAVGVGNDGSNYADAGAYESPPTSGPFPGKATTPAPSDSSTGQLTTVDISWVTGGDTTSYDVYFGTDSTPDETEFKLNQAGTTYDPGALSNSTTYYWRIDAKNALDTTTGDIWSFTTTTGTAPAKAILPGPPNAASAVSRYVRLYWSNGGEATSFKLYVGPTSESLVLVSTQENLSYDLGLLPGSTAKYWRVDSIKGGDTTTGDVWSFTTHAAGKPMVFLK